MLAYAISGGRLLILVTCVGTLMQVTAGTSVHDNTPLHFKLINQFQLYLISTTTILPMD